MPFNHFNVHRFTRCPTAVFIAALFLAFLPGLSAIAQEKPDASAGKTDDTPLNTSDAIFVNLPESLKGHGGPIKAISVSVDGKTALTASFDYSVIHWDISGKEASIIHRLEGHDSAVNDVAFVPETTRAVSVSDDGSLAIWDLETGKLINRIMSTQHKVLDVSVSDDGKLAAASRWDGTARVYNLEKQEEIAVLEGHKGNVNASVFSSDGLNLYTASYDGQIIEWDIATQSLVRPVYRHGWGINSIGRIDDDKLLFGALDGTVAIASISRTEKLLDVFKSERPVQSVKVSQDLSLYGYADGLGTIGVFKTETNAEMETGTVTFGPVWDFDFVPGTAQIYHVGLDDFAARWQIAPSKVMQIQAKVPRRFQIRDTTDPGELEFMRKCSVCHTLEADGENRAGPTLYALFGRKAGTLPGYNYSQALLDSDIIWNEITIGQLFDDGPDVVTPGTKMPIQRLKSVERRDDLIEFLKKATAK